MNTEERTRYLTGYWYDKTAADGREALLFGKNSREKCLSAVCRTVCEHSYFGLFSEFPLAGEPFLDLSVYSIPDGSHPSPDFINGDGFGYRPLFDYCRIRNLNSLGFEFDLSADAPANPNAVVFPPERYLQDSLFLYECLRLLGLEDRIPFLSDRLGAVPAGWTFVYFGGYNGRKGRPLRIVFRLHSHQVLRYRNDPGAFLSDLSRFGYFSACPDILPSLNILFSYAGNCKLSFDLMPDGSLGPAIGCEYGMTRRTPVDFLPDRFMQSENAAFLRALETAGFIDGRWQSAVQSAFAAVSEEYSEEAAVKILQQHAVHTVKLRFCDGKTLSPKMYTQYHCSPLPC